MSAALAVRVFPGLVSSGSNQLPTSNLSLGIETEQFLPSTRTFQKLSRPSPVGKKTHNMRKENIVLIFSYQLVIIISYYYSLLLVSVTHMSSHCTSNIINQYQYISQLRHDQYQQIIQLILNTGLVSSSQKKHTCEVK